MPPEETVRLRALAHPVRLRMLSLLAGAPMSAAELARELGTTQANASYHLRQLRAAGEVVEVERESVRGGRAVRYRYRPRGESPPPRDPDVVGTRAPAYDALASELRRRGREAVPSPHASWTDAELWVDPKVWADVVRRVHAASCDLHDAAEPPRAPGTTRVSATMALFEMHP